MRRADAVCVLSDHESWSMVITEAKALGVPVIATRTSGALEQIEDGKNGVLCGFSDEEIAENLRAFLTGRRDGDDAPGRETSSRRNIPGHTGSAIGKRHEKGSLCIRRYKLRERRPCRGARAGARRVRRSGGMALFR